MLRVNGDLGNVYCASRLKRFMVRAWCSYYGSKVSYVGSLFRFNSTQHKLFIFSVLFNELNSSPKVIMSTDSICVPLRRGGSPPANDFIITRARDGKNDKLFDLSTQSGACNFFHSLTLVDLAKSHCQGKVCRDS